MGGDLLPAGETFLGALAEHDDTGEAGAEVIVDVLGDTPTFPFDGVTLLEEFEPASHPPPRDITSGAACRAERQQDDASPPPPGVPHMWQHYELQHRALFIPHPLAAAGPDPE